MTLRIPFTAIYPDGPAGSSADGAFGGAAGSDGGNADYPGLPAGAVPKHVDKLIATAATTDLWTPPTGRRFVVTHFLVTTDVDQTVVLYDQDEVEGQRILRIPASAQGGADGNSWPVNYESKLAGNVLRLRNTASGNLFVSVDGFERD